MLAGEGVADPPVGFAPGTGGFAAALPVAGFGGAEPAGGAGGVGGVGGGVSPPPGGGVSPPGGGAP